jgi:hypothetical protein
MEPIPVFQEVLRSLRKPPFKTMVKAGHNCGKTACAAMAINHFFDTYDPSVVISMAPTKRAVGVLWTEVRKQRQRAGLPDVFVGPVTPEMRTSHDHFAMGVTGHRSASFAGSHDENMLFVMDDAVDISPNNWHVFNTMFAPQPGHAWLALCTPTDTTSEAYMQECGADWHKFTLSSLDHPNVIRELQGLAPLIPNAVSLGQVNNWIAEWCEPIRVDQVRPGDLEWPPRSGKWYKPSLVFQCRVQGLWPLPEIGCDMAYTGKEEIA